MTDQQPRTAAHVKHEIQHGAVLVAAKMHANQIDKELTRRIEFVNTTLAAQIAELRDTVAAQAKEIRHRVEVSDNTLAELYVLKGRIQALEAPASAPEPDPLCARDGCGHRKSDHQGASGRGVNCIAAIRVVSTEGFGVRSCDCTEFVPQPSPATAHQKPPDAVLKPVRPEPYVDKDGVKITPRRDNEIWQAVSYGHTLAYQKMPLTTTKEQPSGVIMQEPDEDAMLAIVQEQLRAIGYEIRSYRRDGAR